MLSQLEIDDLSIESHRVMTINGDFKEIGRFHSGETSVSIVNRTHFDAFLRRRAIENGVEFLQDSFQELSGNTAIFKSGNRVSFDRLIGADGANSRVRASFVSNEETSLSLSLSTVVPLSHGAIASLREKGIQIHLFNDLPGFGWLFPRGDEVVLGLSSSGNDQRTYMDLMKKLLLHTGLSISNPIRRAVVPSGNRPVTAGAGAVLLIGDAAGLCDRLSAEGILHALESGFLAADAVIEDNEFWHENARCVRIVNQSRKNRQLLHLKPLRKLAFKALSSGEKWSGKYWDLISGTSENTETRTWKRITD